MHDNCKICKHLLTYVTKQKRNKVSFCTGDAAGPYIIYGVRVGFHEFNTKDFFKFKKCLGFSDRGF